MTRAQRYCEICRWDPTVPCDAHRAEYERMLELYRATRPRFRDRLVFVSVAWVFVAVFLWLLSGAK